MLPRFIALSADNGADCPSNAGGLRTAIAAAGLELRLDRPCLQVFADPAMPSTPVGDCGLVLGRLHARGGERIAGFDPPAAARLLWDSGGALTRSFWGSYVAFLDDTAHGRRIALRDPSGAIPLYAAQTRGQCCYFSDPGLAFDLGLIGREVDRAFVAHWLAFPHLRTARTGIAGVRELLPGMRRIAQHGEERIEAVWTPWDHVGAQPILDFDEAARQLRETVLGAVSRLAAGRRRILVELSGGLDSSVVAAALAECGAPFSCINFATGQRDGDERHYARAVAARLGVDLAEILLDDHEADLCAPPRVRRLRPGAVGVLGPIDAAITAHARRIDAETLFSGGGGDNVFCFLSSAAPILDALTMRGPRVAGVAWRDVAALTGSNLWTAARYALRKARRRGSRPVWRTDRDFLPPETAAIPVDVHPWLETPSDILSGQREHVEGLVVIQDFLDASDRAFEIGVERLLLAQPIVELCLRIPSWLWVRGGRNRAVARAAFADLLPPAILNRRTKGRLETMCVQAFMRNRAHLRPLLLEGQLAGERIVDRAAIEAYLDAGERPVDHRYFRLLDIATLELWLRGWRGIS